MYYVFVTTYTLWVNVPNMGSHSGSIAAQDQSTNTRMYHDLLKALGNTFIQKHKRPPINKDGDMKILHTYRDEKKLFRSGVFQSR